MAIKTVKSTAKTKKRDEKLAAKGSPQKAGELLAGLVTKERKRIKAAKATNVQEVSSAQQEINSLRARLASTRRLLKRLHEDYCTMVDRDFDPGNDHLIPPSESPLFYPLRASVLKAINPPKPAKAPILKSATAPTPKSGGVS